jgi:hypothetical protein
MLFGLGYEGPLKTVRDRWPKIRSKIRLTERVYVRDNPLGNRYSMFFDEFGEHPHASD